MSSPSTVRVRNRMHVMGGPGTGTAQVQSVPVRINYSGPADIEGKFSIEDAKNSADEQPTIPECPQRARFRGRLLDGKTITLPENTLGLVLKDVTSQNTNGNDVSKEDLSSDDSANESGDDDQMEDKINEGTKQWRLEKKFHEINYWVHGSVPSKQDFLPGSFDMFEVSKDITEPVTQDDYALLDRVLSEHSCKVTTEN